MPKFFPLFHNIEIFIDMGVINNTNSYNVRVMTGYIFESLKYTRIYIYDFIIYSFIANSWIYPPNNDDVGDMILS